MPHAAKARRRTGRGAASPRRGKYTGRCMTPDITSSAAAWRARKRPGRSRARDSRAVLHEMRPVRPTAGASDRPAGRTGLQQFAEVRAGRLRALAAEGGTAAAGFAGSAGGRSGPRSRRPCAHGGPRCLLRGSDARDRSRIRSSNCAARRSRDVPDDGITIIATGPLTSDALAAEIGRLTGSGPPVLLRQHQPDRRCRHRSITTIAFRASRYGKSLDGTDDYLNCPFDRAAVRALRGRAAGRRSRLVAHRQTTCRTSKPACPSRSWRGAAATRCASVP